MVFQNSFKKNSTAVIFYYPENAEMKHRRRKSSGMGEAVRSGTGNKSDNLYQGVVCKSMCQILDNCSGFWFFIQKMLESEIKHRKEKSSGMS